MDNVHKTGEEVKKLPEDPEKLKKIIAERAKALVARLVEKLKK